MRRLLALAVSALLVPSMAVMAENTGEYRDDFGDGSYSGNDGNLQFGGPWVEHGDNGSAGSGKVHVGSESCSGNECLHLEGELLTEGTFGVSRPVDVSLLQEPTLTFDLRATAVLGLLGGEIRIQGYDGVAWKTIKTYGLGSAFTASKSVSLASFENRDFQVRFEVGPLQALGDPFIGYVTIDDVAIIGAIQSPSTTTSTTIKPTTTTSRPKATTTTSTVPSTTTTSTVPSTTTTRATSSTTSRPETTTTTTAAFTPSSSTTTTTTTTIPLSSVAAGGPPDGSRPVDGGLRDPGVGLLADYKDGMMGDLDMDQVEVLGVTIDADFSMAVEVFEAARIWIALLVLVVSVAIIGGVDRRRRSAAGSSES